VNFVRLLFAGFQLVRDNELTLQLSVVNHFDFICIRFLDAYGTLKIFSTLICNPRLTSPQVMSTR
jgi:hypothetical protein